MSTAALVAGLGVLLLLSQPARLRRLQPSKPPRQRRMSPWAGLVALVGIGVLGVLGFRVVGWLAVTGIVFGTAGWLILVGRRRGLEARRATECASAARLLSSLLRAGQIPSAALAEAAEDAPVLAAAAAAARLGADVGAELARAASVPGQSGMLAVAAAWQVSERSGAPVAGVLGEVSQDLRRERQLRSVVDAELAAVRTSGHIMAALPFFAVALGFLAGADPLSFLFGDTLGQVLVLTAATLTAVGVLWIDRLARGRKTQHG